jgi:outer membrane protein assembly factor BamB
MTRHLYLAWLGLVLAASAALAQTTPFPKDMLPSQRALARLGLERHWYGVVPLGGTGEKVLELSVDENLVFVQTNQGNFHVLDSESGRLLWSQNLGRNAVDVQAASSNATAVFVTNSNVLYACDRASGRIMWQQFLEHLPASSTAADEARVWVGLTSGNLSAYDIKSGKPLWNFQAKSEISSRPHPAGRVVVFASHDGKVYVSRTEAAQILMRWGSGGPITAPLGTHGVRTLLVPSGDKSLYAVDLWTGDTKWNFPTGAPVEQEPLIAGDEAFIVNNQGLLSSVSAVTGEAHWTISTLGGPLLGVTPKRVYLESRDGDLFIVDRVTGSMLFDPRAVHERAGLNLREFQLGPTNRLNDRVYICSRSGLLVCLREAGAVKPVLLRDPKEKPFGYIPPEGYSDTPKIAPAAPLPSTDKPEEGAATTKPKE